MIFVERVLRWASQEGLRGSFRKIKNILRYWHFRAIVHSLRNKNVPRITSFSTLASFSPTFSILLSAYRTKPAWLRQAVDSVLSQTYENWELCIGFCEISEEARRYLDSLAGCDKRVRVFDLSTNLGISENSNFLATKAVGEFLAVLDHDDYLEPQSLAEFSSMVNLGPFDLLYSDEDVVSPRLRIPSPPNLKPDWAPDSFRSCNYICHFCCFRRSLFEEVGGFCSQYDGAQDYDLFLKIVEKTDRIAHIPKVLYHWRRHGLSTASGRGGNAKPLAWETARLAMQAHLQRCGERALAELGTAFGSLRVRYHREEDPLIDIIIPSSNRGNMLVRCLRSITHVSQYPNYRVTVMLNGRGDFEELRSVYGGDDRIRLINYTEPFNFSRINNVAAQKSEADVLLFLNDDIEIIEADWMEGLLEHALRDKVGAVGPKLLYPNGRIQQAGISVDPEFIAWDLFKNLPQSSGGYQARAQMIQNVSAVTGACLCTRRKCFLEVGGFDEEFPLAYNDVDYCLKLLAEGYRIVYTPFVRMIHDESFTRGKDSSGEKRDRLRLEIDRMRAKWGKEGLRDRYFNAAFLKPGANLRDFAVDYLTLTESKDFHKPDPRK